MISPIPWHIQEPVPPLKLCHATVPFLDFKRCTYLVSKPDDACAANRYRPECSSE